MATTCNTHGLVFLPISRIVGSSRIVNGSNVAVTLRVRSGIETESFNIMLLLMIHATLLLVRWPEVLPCSLCERRTTRLDRIKPLLLTPSVFNVYFFLAPYSNSLRTQRRTSKHVRSHEPTVFFGRVKSSTSARTHYAHRVFFRFFFPRALHRPTNNRDARLRSKHKHVRSTRNALLCTRRKREYQQHVVVVPTKESSKKILQKTGECTG
jgi:hypothetical protein